MTKPGRIPCINPRCRRTAAQEKHPNSEDMICYGCWRATPIALRKRALQLEKREKKVSRIIEKSGMLAAESVTVHRVWRQMNRTWGQIRRYWQVPDANMPPEGLDDFLKEVGLT